MENKEILDTVFKNQTPEIYIDFTNSSRGNMIINLNYNKTLSEEKKPKNKIQYLIQIIYYHYILTQYQEPIL